MARPLKSRAPVPPGALPEVPLGGTRAEAMRRLQMGAVGVIAVLLLIGLASVVKDRATQTANTAVAEAAATVAPGPSNAAPDPLAEAGVVPDIPASPTARVTAPSAVSSLPPVPATGNNRGDR